MGKCNLNHIEVWLPYGVTPASLILSIVFAKSNDFFFFILLYHFYIYSHVYTLLATPPHTHTHTSRQNLFHPLVILGL
jgi:hypothetical protein